MPLELLIDGYNVVAPIAPPRNQSSDTRWLQRERSRLVKRLLQHLPPSKIKKTCVVFDAANPPADRASEQIYSGMLVRFAVGYPQADDLIGEIISEHSSPKRLTVVSSDHRVQAYARRRGACPVDSDPWMDALLDGKFALPESNSDAEGRAGEWAKPEGPENDQEVDRWLEEFGFEP